VTENESGGEKWDAEHSGRKIRKAVVKRGWTSRESTDPQRKQTRRSGRGKRNKRPTSANDPYWPKEEKLKGWEEGPRLCSVCKTNEEVSRGKDQGMREKNRKITYNGRTELVGNTYVIVARLREQTEELE